PPARARSVPPLCERSRPLCRPAPAHVGVCALPPGVPCSLSSPSSLHRLVVARFFLVGFNGRLDLLLQKGAWHTVFFSDIVQPEHALRWSLAGQPLHFNP